MTKLHLHSDQNHWRWLLSSKVVGLGRRGFNIELGAEGIEQIIVHLNTPPAADYTVFKVVYDILAEAIM